MTPENKPNLLTRILKFFYRIFRAILNLLRFLMIGKQTKAEFPYVLQNNFLSPSELAFFNVLRAVVDKREAVLCTKVRLSDIFRVKKSDRRGLRIYANKIDRKHVDFLVCDLATMRPLMGIELDDKSHQRRDRQERDAFVDQVFKAASLPLLHVPVKGSYAVTELEAQLASFLAAKPEEEKRITPPDSVPQATASSSITNQPPLCPTCGSMMVLRTVKSGVNAGNRFWGCSTYPNCRSILPYQREKHE